MSDITKACLADTGGEGPGKTEGLTKPGSGTRRQVSRDERLPAQAMRPASLAMADRSRAELWKWVSLGTCLTALLVSYLSVRAARAEEHILVLDPAGNVLAGPAEGLAESRGFFTLTTLYCANTALQRSAEGFDLYELLHLYFSPRAVQKLEEHWQGQKEDARARNLQQKPVIDLVGEPVKAGSLRVVEARGRIIRAGAYAGRSFYEEIPFTLVLSFKRNPDLGKTGAYPWICEDLDITTGEGGP